AQMIAFGVLSQRDEQIPDRRLGRRRVDLRPRRLHQVKHSIGYRVCVGGRLRGGHTAAPWVAWNRVSSAASSPPANASSALRLSRSRRIEATPRIRPPDRSPTRTDPWKGSPTA